MDKTFYLIYLILYIKTVQYNNTHYTVNITQYNTLDFEINTIHYSTMYFSARNWEKYYYLVPTLSSFIRPCVGLSVYWSVCVPLKTFCLQVHKDSTSQNCTVYNNNFVTEPSNQENICSIPVNYWGSF